MLDDGTPSGSPLTGPIVGGILAGLIVILASVIIFRLALRRVRRTQAIDTEQPSGDAEKAVVVKRPSTEETQAEAADQKSVTRTIDYTEETGDSSHPGPLPEPTQEETRLVPPVAATAKSSSTLQVAKPMARLGAASGTETQSVSATSFATALQSPRSSEHV